MSTPSSSDDDEVNHASSARSRASGTATSMRRLSMEDRSGRALRGNELSNSATSSTAGVNTSSQPHEKEAIGSGPSSKPCASNPKPPQSCTASQSTVSSFNDSSLSTSFANSQLEVGTNSTALPLHGPRPVQARDGSTLEYSSKQAEYNAQSHPFHQQSSPSSSHIFPNAKSILPPQTRQPLEAPSEPLKTPERKSVRPRPIYVPVPEEGKAINPFAFCTNGKFQNDNSVSHSLLEAHKQITSSFTPSHAANVHATERPKLPVNFRSGSAFPYPSIYPVNERRLTHGPFDPPRSPPDLPTNYYTSPNRVHNAAFNSGRKRKRGWPVLPPPAYIYTRTNNPNFNIFDGILLYPELCFALAANLRVSDLVSLYAISKDFHTILDTRFATVVLSQTLRKCPESSRVFPFRCYKHLCRPDPAPRIPHPHPTKRAAGEVRLVPSFRWLKFVLFRDKVCHEIMTIMAEDGVPLPSRCELALKRMWFMMDIPDNARRIGYMHTKRVVGDLDLYFMMCFIVKLDMRFNDPIAPNRFHGLRKTLLARQGLLPLWRALKRTSLLTRYDIFDLWITTKCSPAPDELGFSMFGNPSSRIGKHRMEYWGKRSTHDTGATCNFLLRPDQLVMREIVRRKIVFSKHFLRCFLWGYVDIVTMENYPPRPWQRRIKGIVEEYDDDDDCGDIHIVSEAIRDDLLDLKVEKPISMLVEPSNQMGNGTSERKSKEEAFLAECMRWFDEETKNH